MTLLFVNSETWTITILGWLIVFAALIFLVGLFLIVPKIINWSTRRSLKKKGKIIDTKAVDQKDVLTGEINAAISMAIYLYTSELHDEESNIITIKEVRRRYSPWSSKLYGMNNTNFQR